MHDVIGVGITIATILAATCFSNQSINNLRSEMHSDLRFEIGSLRSEVMGKLDSIQRDMRDLYAEQARHDVRITNLEQQHKN
jgi:outer membrane murein-binding lipoprotein Lpp